MRINLANLAVTRCQQVLVLEHRLHFHHRAAGRVGHAARRQLVLLLRAVHRQVILRLGGRHLGRRRVERRTGLVALLSRGHALLVEVVDALKRLAGNRLGGDCLLPHVIGGLLQLATGAGIGLAALGGGGVLHALSLKQLRVKHTRIDAHQSVALAHLVALAHKEAHHAATCLAANAHLVTVGLTLHNRVRGLNQQHANDGDARHNDGKHHKRHQQAAVAAAHSLVVLFLFHIS